MRGSVGSFKTMRNPLEIVSPCCSYSKLLKIPFDDPGQGDRLSIEIFQLNMDFMQG